MTDKQVLQQALDALESRCGTHADERGPGGVIEALRSALARQNEPSDEQLDAIAIAHFPHIEPTVEYFRKMFRDVLAQLVQPDARKIIEQMVEALEIAERHLAYVEITEAREAGQQWLGVAPTVHPIKEI